MQAGVAHSESGPSRRSRCAPWLAAFLYVAGFLVLCHPAYLISDDVGILRNLENGFEAPFISMLCGKMLLALYRAAPSVPWYGLLLAAAHGISLGLFLSALFRLSCLRRWVWPVALLYLAVYTGFLLRMSFNSASMMLGINALLAWLSFRASGSVPRSVAVLGLGCALAGSYLIRVDGFYLALLLGLPVLWPGAAPRRAMLFATPVILVMISNTVVVPRFVPKSYHRYAAYNLVRGRFMDFPIIQANTNNTKLMAAMNWSANDYKTLTHWFFLDEEVFSQSQFEDIMGRPDLARRTPPQYLRYSLRTFWGRYYRHIWLLALVLVAAFHRAERQAWGRLLLYAVYALAVMIGIAVFYRFPPRVGAPSFLAVTSALLFLAAVHPAPPPASSLRYGALAWWAAALFMAGLWISDSASWNRGNRADRAILNETAAVLREYPGSTLFVAEPAIGIRLEALHPLRARRAYPENILPAGWATFSPLFYAVLNRHGLERAADVLPRAVDNSGILFIFFNENFGDIITTWLREHAGKEVRVEKVRPLPDERGLYRVVSAGAGD
jgi:hypothetical protein